MAATLLVHAPGASTSFRPWYRAPLDVLTACTRGPGPGPVLAVLTMLTTCGGAAGTPMMRVTQAVLVTTHMPLVAHPHPPKKTKDT